MKRLLAVLVLFAGCQAAVCPVKVQTVTETVEVTIPIRPELTAKPPKPKRPTDQCRDAKGRPSMCNKALADWVNAYDALVDKLYGKLDAIQELQPKP